MRGRGAGAGREDEGEESEARTRGGGPGTKGPAKAGAAGFIRPAARGGGTAGGERRRLRAAAPLRRGAANCSTPGSPVAPPAASAGVQLAKPRCAPGSGSPAFRRPGPPPPPPPTPPPPSRGGWCRCGLAWAPGPQPERAVRGGLRGPWGWRSGALAGVQPAPHAAPGTGAPRRPRKPSAGDGGVPASDESAPAPAPAAVSCPAGLKDGNRSSITATDPSEAPPPAPPPHARPAETRSAAGRLALPPEPRCPRRRRRGVFRAAAESQRGRTRGGGGAAEETRDRGGRYRTPPGAPRVRWKAGGARQHRRKLGESGGPRSPPTPCSRDTPTLPAPETPRLLIGPHRAENLPPPLAPGLEPGHLLRHGRLRPPGDPGTPDAAWP